MSSLSVDRRRFLSATLPAVLGCTPGGASPHEPFRTSRGAARERRPNVVLILADDLGFSDLGCYGSEIETPNLDALAAGGLRFVRFYNAARCVPSRASLMTGLYPCRAADRGLKPEAVTIAEVLRGAGYRTALSGKWDGSAGESSKENWPLQRGFERFFGTLTGAGSYFHPPFLTAGNDPIAPEEADFYYTDAISSFAVRCIDEFFRGEAPFFLYVSYTAPHWPLHAHPEDIRDCEERYLAGWEAVRTERHRGMIAKGIVDPKWPLTPRDRRVPPWEESSHKKWQARRMAVYAAQVQCMDRGIGRILEKLRSAGIEENTLVLFLSDNGACEEEMDLLRVAIPAQTRDGRPVRAGSDPAIMPGPADTFQSYGVCWANVSNTPFRLYKHWVHEGGIATPMIARWPARIRARGATNRHTGHVIDVMATCLDIAGARYPGERGGRPVPGLEGKSMLPVFEGRKPPGRTALFWEHEGNRAVMKGRWKLVSRHPLPWYHGRAKVVDPGDGRWELYDMEEDRTEMRNLAGEFPARVDELRAEYERWAEGCRIPEWNPNRRP